MAALTPLPIVPPPGVVLDESDRVIQGRWKASSNIRFVHGLPEKIGGHSLAAATATDGQPRALHAWRDLAANQYLAAGTYRKLYVYDTDMVRNDITPFRITGTYANNPFTTTNGSPNVSVSHTGHGLSAGDTIIIAGASAVGGITPNGTFTVFTVTNANAFVFVFTSNATSGATGGGASATYEYEVSVGTELGTTGLGWGVGGWGLGTWGTARDNSTIVFEPRVWSLDHFGKLLIASYNGGSVYTFDPSDAQPWGRAEKIADAPDDCRFVFVTPERFIFALREEMVVSWCSQGDYTDWTTAADNTARSRTLSVGNKLIAGRVLSPNISLVWTDAALYSFQYTGSQFVYNSAMVARDCGLIGPNAAVTVNGIAYWMGTNNFLMYNGSVQPMPNVEDIRSAVYDAMATELGYQCAAVYIPRFNEIWFLYTVEGQTSPTKGIIYSIDDQCWAPLEQTRVSGTHFDQGDTRPYLGNSDGFIYLHEDGYDADGDVMECSLELAPYALNEGGQGMDVEGIVWDFFNQSGDLAVTLTAYDRLTDASSMDSQSDTVPDTDAGLTDVRLSGRYVGILVESAELGGYFRWGRPVAWVKPTWERR